MPYGIIKVDTITFTDAGVDKSIQISGLVQNPTFSGNVTCTGTISGVTVTGTVGAFTTVSGITVTGTTANFTSGNFTNISGGTYTITSGVFAAGSAASPSISFTGDPNTGIYSPGADQVAISTNGTGRVFIDDQGRVGVGAVPIAGSPNLELRGLSTTSSPSLGVTTSDYSSNFTTTSIRQYGSAATSTTAGLSRASLGELLFQNTSAGLVRTNGAAPIVFAVSDSERMRLTSDGRLGLGTSSPVFNLVVAGSGTDGCWFNSSGTQSRVGFGAIANGASGAFQLLYDRSTGLTTFGTGSRDTLSSAFCIDANGRLGIGTTSPGSALEINAAAATSPFIAKINTAEAARIDSSGRLLVGTSTSLGGTVSIAGGGLYLSANDSNAEMQLTRASANSGGPLYYFNKSRGTYSSPTVVSDGDVCGTINFRGHDGSAYIAGASISAAVDGTPGTNDMPGRLVFSTTADGASSPTERMVIKSNGDIRINQNTTSTPGLANTTAGVAIENTNAIFASRANGIALFLNRNSDGATAEFHQSGNVVGTITVTASATAYNTSSDYRLKENIVPLTGAANRLNQLQVHRFNFIADPDKTVDGFLAHEAQAVVPECVTGTKDEVDEDGNPVYQGIDQSKLVPLLTAALQEALAEIASLKDRVAALEAQ